MRTYNSFPKLSSFLFDFFFFLTKFGSNFNWTSLFCCDSNNGKMSLLLIWYFLNKKIRISEASFGSISMACKMLLISSMHWIFMALEAKFIQLSLLNPMLEFLVGVFDLVGVSLKSIEMVLPIFFILWKKPSFLSLEDSRNLLRLINLSNPFFWLR